MSLTSWLFNEHQFFRELRHHLRSVIEARRIRNLDDLVIASRRPVRTVLLMLDEMIRSEEVTVFPDAITINSRADSPHLARPKRGWAWNDDGDKDEIISRYVQLASEREAPALVWGQRRLIPESAVERAFYILCWLTRYDGKIVFLGEDDLVSPLVAALAPSCEVHVVDIDRGVLNAVDKTASALGTKVHTYHNDLSQAALDHNADSDIVISDPFPSGDGSFEGVFWSHVVRVLRPGGISITTVAPSHKPIGYDARALSLQQGLGLSILDLQADFGWYESFEFEFTAFEKDILARHHLRSRVHHTKSIMAARKESLEVLAAGQSSPEIDFEKWSSATMHHYLTVQAGVEQQKQIAVERGLGPAPSKEAAITKRGLRVDLIAPPELRRKVAVDSTTGKQELIESWNTVLAEMGVAATDEEIIELVRLAEAASIEPQGPSASLDLAIRALESWERWRLD